MWEQSIRDDPFFPLISQDVQASFDPLQLLPGDKFHRPVTGHPFKASTNRRRVDSTFFFSANGTFYRTRKGYIEGIEKQESIKSAQKKKHNKHPKLQRGG